MSIQEALNIIINGGEVTLIAHRSQGKQQGEGYEKRCRYGAPDGYERNFRAEPFQNDVYTEGSPKPEERQRKIALHVENGTIPMTDLETNQYFSPNIYHIVKLNGKRVDK
jgi:hypothetical protein